MTFFERPGPIEDDPVEAAASTPSAAAEPSRRAEPEASSVAEPEASGVAEPEASSVAEPEASSVAEPEASGVAEPEASGVAEPEASGVAARAGRWRGLAPVLILGVVSIGLAVALAISLLSLDQRDRTDSARRSALAAATTYSVELSSYSYTQLDKDFEVVLSHSTPAFQANYTKSSSALDKVLVQYKASAQGSVVAAGIESASTNRAVVLVDVDQKTTNSTRKGATEDESRLQMTLVRQGGRWLIDKLSLL